MTKKVLIAGFTGAMGQKAVNLVNNMPGFEVVAGLSPIAENNPEQYHLPADAKIFKSLTEIPDHLADFWIDFTTPKAVYDNVKFALQHHIRPIVGTTGMSDEQEAELIELSRKEKVGGLIAPNCGMTAVLLMRFAKEAEK